MKRKNESKNDSQKSERQERWLRRLRNTKIAAFLIVLSVVIGGAAQLLGGVNSLIVESQALISRLQGTNLNSEYQWTVSIHSGGRTDTRTTTSQYSKVKDDHPSFAAANGRNYSHTFMPVDGYKIVDASFQTTTSTHATAVTISPHRDGTARLNFNLESGPQVDRYRGILAGTATLVQQRIIPPTETQWSQVKVSSTGKYPLGPAPEGREIQSVLLRGKDGNLVGQGALGHSISISKAALKVRVELSEKKLGILIVEK